MNFNPPVKKSVDEIVSVNDIVKFFNNSKAKKEVGKSKKRKASESSSSDSDSDEEETFTPKVAKIDLSITECYKCHKTGHMSRKLLCQVLDWCFLLICLFEEITYDNSQV